MKKIRFGIAGSGNMGRAHAEAIRRLPEEAELAAVWGGRRAPALAERFGADCESSVEALMRRPDLDAIVVATPHQLHVRDTLLALEGGKHVLVEKPLATTVADCDRMIEAAASRGLVLATAYLLRFRNNPIQARRLIREGALGRLFMVHSLQLFNLGDLSAFGGYEWMKDPASIGNIVDALPHTLDLIRWFTTAEAATVSAVSRTFLPDRPAVEDSSVSLVEFDNGMLCTLATSCALPASLPGEECHLRLLGTEGVLDFDAYGEVHLFNRAGRHLICTQPSVGAYDVDSAYGDVRIAAFRDQIRSFLDGVRGRPMQAGTGADGRAGVAACLAMLQSSREQRWIRLGS
jgi:UDP-N-acetyl-2-amino-2-deoxyglucuronate dehydrogenase